MYEQSIPAIAYVFIGITSLAVTYSQLMKSQPDDETEQTDSLLTEESIESSPSSSPNTIEPTAPVEPETIQQMNSNVPIVEAVPVTSTSNSMTNMQNKGGKQKKRGTSHKTKSIQKVKKILKKNKTKKNTKAK